LEEGGGGGGVERWGVEGLESGSVGVGGVGEGSELGGEAGKYF
jgi:hypothetical protein